MYKHVSGANAVYLEFNRPKVCQVVTNLILNEREHFLILNRVSSFPSTSSTGGRRGHMTFEDVDGRFRVCSNFKSFLPPQSYLGG